MSAKLYSLAGVVGIGLLAVACGIRPADEDVAGDQARVTQSEFDKNMLVSDTAMRDSAAMSAEDIQGFLEKTPWNKKSVLATYSEDGKTAAEIMHDAADKYGINPLELLTRVQMEQGLINKTTASAESISIAFGCGCPHSPVCSSKYEGFANQADCAAGTLRRSMDKAVTTTGTVSGWKRGSGKVTQDKVEVTPENAATAALYTYTPYVGEAGGGKTKGVGGASLHNAVWDKFAESISYGVQNPPGNVGGGAGGTRAADGGAPSSGSNENTDPPAQADAGNGGGGNGGNDPGEEEEGSGSPSTADAGGSTGSNGSAGSNPNGGASGETEADGGAPPKKKGDTSNGNPGDGSNDDDLLGEGNAPPATNAPPPSSGSSKSSKTQTGGEEEATDEELGSKKKAAEGGCSSSGSSSHNGSDAALAALALVAAAVVARRRRQEQAE